MLAVVVDEQKRAGAEICWSCWRMRAAGRFESAYRCRSGMVGRACHGRGARACRSPGREACLKRRRLWAGCRRGAVIMALEAHVPRWPPRPTRWELGRQE